MKDARTLPRRFSAPGYRCVVAADFAPGALRLGLDQPQRFDRVVDSALTVRGGRGPNRLLSSEDWQGRVRLRPLYHGGLLGRWLGNRYLTARRSEREFRIWKILEDRGAPLPPAALAASRRRGGFWRPSFAALNQENAQDLASWLEAREPSSAELLSLTRAVAQGVRRFHDAGGLHRDLHLGNVLVEVKAGGFRVWLIDLDRTRICDAPSEAQRMRDLMRLARSAEKRGRPEARSPRLRAAFLSAYCQGDRALRCRLRAAEAREVRRLRRHRLGWRLSRNLAGLAGIAASLAMLACEPPGETSPNAPPGTHARLSLLATGDTGRTRFLPALFEGQLAVAHAMRTEDLASPVDGLILLGDNFYWYGLDREHLVERVRRNLVKPYCHFLSLSGPRSAEIESACGIPENTRHPIPIYAVLGNHDLELPESAFLQREVVPDFVPEWRMSPNLADVIELGGGVSLILFESEISITDPVAIETALSGAIRSAEGPWRILATHRPIATDDVGGPPRGGYPVWVRSAIADAGRPVQLVLAAHHHNLQAFALEEPSRLLQIGVGSGSRAEPPLAQDPPGSLFGALEVGFARIDLIGGGIDERLVVSIFGTSEWPLVARLRGHALLARFAVDLDGGVSEVGSGTGPVAP